VKSSETVPIGSATFYDSFFVPTASGMSSIRREYYSVMVKSCMDIDLIVIDIDTGELLRTFQHWSVEPVVDICSID